MTYFLEASVGFDDGTARVEHHERADAEGRRAMDRWSFDRMTERNVFAVRVSIVDRVASTTKGKAR